MSSQTKSWMPLNILKPTVICKFNIPGKSAFFLSCGIPDLYLLALQEV